MYVCMRGCVCASVRPVRGEGAIEGILGSAFSPPPPTPYQEALLGEYVREA